MDDFLNDFLTYYWGGFLLGAIIYCLVCAFIAKKINTDKGRSSKEGFLYGFFLGIIGIIVVALLPTNENALSQVKIAEGVNKKCPYCAEVIKSEAVVCRFCGREQPVSIPNSSSKTIAPQKDNSNLYSSLITKVLICAVLFGVGYWTLDIAGLGIAGGLAIGIIKGPKIWRWVLAGTIVGIVGNLIVILLLRGGYSYLLFEDYVLPILFALAFTIVSKEWKNLLWLIILGTLGFIIAKSFAVLANSLLVHGILIGMGYGLIFGILDLIRNKNLANNEPENVD